MNTELCKLLIDAAYRKNINLLMQIIDENQPDFSSDDFKIKSFDKTKISIRILNKDVRSSVISGYVQPCINKDWYIFPQSFKGKDGVFSVNSQGEWLFNITNSVLLDKIKESMPVIVNESIDVFYQKPIEMASISHEILCYICAYRSEIDVQKVLNLGACPNFGSKFMGKLSRIAGIYKDAAGGGSMPLLNSVRRNNEKIVEVLIDHSCTCCGGNGAKITDSIIKESHGEIRKKLLEKLQNG